jgi:ATP-dependent exoDNAse (exonuclease V) alpha subunit
MKQKQALDLLKTGRNVFITGPAGSGKTHLVNSYIAYLKQNNIEVGVTASTGIAATHMGGMTIHSWAGIGINTYLSEGDLEAMAEKSYLAKRFEKVKVLIIDEVSMLHHFRLDLIDRVLRAMKLPNEPFGGVQVVLVGDFFQLPPVARFGEPPAQFIYHSDAWHAAGFTICYLEEQFRQQDDVAISILNEIRAGDISQKTRKLLESRVKAKTKAKSGATTETVTTTVAGPEPTRLFTHNEDVDAINQAELERLATTEEAEYEMTWRGKEFIVETLKKSCLAHEKLRLKVGARVMCVKNNFEQGYVNGTLGTVVSCKGGQDPVIMLATDTIIEKPNVKIKSSTVARGTSKTVAWNGMWRNKPIKVSAKNESKKSRALSKILLSGKMILGK